MRYSPVNNAMIAGLLAREMLTPHSVTHVLVRPVDDYETGIGAVDTQLRTADVRLAGMLNATFAPSAATLPTGEATP